MEEGRVKFVSKNVNLSIVLEHGISEDKLSGRPAISGLYVRFRNGVVTTNTEIAEKMRKHSGFNSDFYEVAEEAPDIFADMRKDTEPAHMIQEMKYGHPEGSMNTPVPVKFTPAQKEAMQKMISEEAAKLASAILPDLVKETLAKIAAAEVKTTEDTAVIKEDIPVPPTNPEPVVVSDSDTPRVNSFVCPGCGKVSKNNAGNLAHQRTCQALHQI